MNSMETILIRCEVLVPESTYPEFERLVTALGGRMTNSVKNSSKKLNSKDIDEMRRLFVEEGLTQAEIGERFGKAPTTIKEYLRGYKKTKPPTVEKLKRSVGRPRLLPEEKLIRDLAARSLRSYSYLRKRYSPESFAQTYKKQEEALIKAMDEGNGDIVRWFDEEKPWIEKDRPFELPNFHKKKTELVNADSYTE
jgi:transcriptional regulator with XRE-family HTH domain